MLLKITNQAQKRIVDLELKYGTVVFAGRKNREPVLKLTAIFN